MSNEEPYFMTENPEGVFLTLDEDPLSEGDLRLAVAVPGLAVRISLDKESANRLADALHRWYASPDAGEPVWPPYDN